MAVFSARDGRVHLGEEIGLHEVGPGQVLVGREHAHQVLARDLHELGQARANAKIHGVEALLKEFVHGHGAAHDHVAFQTYALSLQAGHLGADDVLGQPEFRDAVDEHAAGFVKSLEEADFMAFEGQVAGHGQAGRPRTDHGHLPARGRVAGGQFADMVLAFPVGGETLQVADGHGFALAAQQAVAFALDLLGADPAADGGQAVAFPDLADGLVEVAFGHVFDEARDVDVHGTALDARRILALQAARGFGDGLFRGVAQGHFLEVAGADGGFLLGHGLSGSFFGCHQCFPPHVQSSWLWRSCSVYARKRRMSSSKST